MQRKFFDMLLSIAGLVLVVALVIGGALLLWGANYANTNVHNQLAKQDIFFPTKAAFAAAKPGTEVTPSMRPYLYQYAGQQVLTGAQAEAYANHFIAVHLSEMPYGGVYAKVSAAAMANPSNAALTAEEQTTFQGTTLRGLLLEAYGFSQFGQIATYGAIGCFTLAGILLVLVLIGFAHARRTSETEQLVVRQEELTRDLIGV
jgi:hypothetical protein